MPSLPPEDMRRVYLALGRALWHLQCVEDALNALLTVKHHIGAPGLASEEEAFEALAIRRRSPLGPSVRLARSTQLIAESKLIQLENLKSERDWVAHRAQYSVGDYILSPWGRQSLTLRLDKITEDAKDVLTALIEEMQRFVSESGHDVQTAPSLLALIELNRAESGA